VPAKPLWYSRIPAIIQSLEALPRPFVDRATIESLLGIGRRRAQQILAPCVTGRVGANGLADRDTLISHLRRLAHSDSRHYEQRRRRNVAAKLAELERERHERPRLLVEAPTHLLNQEFESLPPGVRLEPGRIIVEFTSPQHALEKLLALAMAISNNFERFERQVQSS
jgi:hypothetical protein